MVVSIKKRKPMKILMLNDYMDSPDAYWRGAQVQTRRLAKALSATVNNPFDMTGPITWDIVNYQDSRSLLRDLRPIDNTYFKVRVATARWHDPEPAVISRYEEMDGIIAISYYVKDILVERGVKPEKIRVIPPCIEVFDVPSKYKVTKNFNVAFAGAIEERKGIKVLLEAMKLLSDLLSKYWIPGVSLHVMGIGRYLQRIENIVKEKDLPIFFHRLLSIKQMRSRICASDVFVLPSLQEAFGSVLLDAMMVETPIIASDVGGIPEVVQHGRDGILVPPGDAEELAKAIWIQAMCEFKAKKAKQKVLKYYTVDRVARLTKEYYQELLEVKND